MRPRPVRSQIYLPALRFGITDEDWGLVIIAGILGYAVPFLSGMKVGAVPLEMVGWVVAMGLSIFILNAIRRHSRPAWLQHVIQAKARGAVRRRRLPGEAAPAWLKQESGE
jgi:hypothetical protein